MASPAPRPELLQVDCLDRAGFLDLAGAWPALLARTGHAAPFYRHGFLAAWLEAFAPQAPVRAVVARDGEGLRAALVLIERHERLYGLGATTLAGAANVHSARYDLIAHREDAPAVEAVWTHLRERLRWDVLELPDVPPAQEGEGAARALLALAERDGLPVGLWESMRTPYVPLPPAPEGSSAKFRGNLRRRRRKLAEQGALALQRVDGGPDLEARLAEGLAVEASGWKGQEGTAMASEPATRAFYSRLAAEAAREGYLALYFLRCGGKAVAFHFGLCEGGRYYLPKPGFDEAYAACSPGQLLVEDVLADCGARGLAEFDFLGPSMSWKRDWTDRERVHHWAYAYRDSAAGRALHAAKFKLAPRVKELLPWKR